MQTRDVMLAIRNEILQDMREQGFYYKGKKLYTPTLWDINCGFCEWFGEEVEERIPGANCFWMDDEGYDCSHYVVEYQGKYYDAECIDGVASLDDLPIIKNRKKTREQVFKERGE